MFALQTITTVLAFLTFCVYASPLTRRDVIAPKITSPNANSMWPVGTVQVVTWDTSDFPPDSQITNPIGKVILGFDENGSLNLDFDNPLAQGFKLRDGSVQITVPDVPPKDDYLIVLMGDSGNTSPTFAITRISSSGSSSSPPSSAAVPPTSASTLVTTPIPITGSTITGGKTDVPTLAQTDAATLKATPANTPASSSTPTPSTSVASTPTLGAATGASTSASWSIHHSGSFSLTLSFSMASIALLIMA